MAGIISNFQDRVKTSSNAISLLLFKVLTGLFLGLTLALIGDAIIDYGWFSFVLVIVVTVGACLKVMRSWTWLHVFIFNLICVLIGLLLRMYILIAPG
ncbi:MAG: hypothetical protein KF799_02585 [Bdellovibrionales bacterium]|nr:hypothetical protein [Bdellovibrionales bacterium]